MTLHELIPIIDGHNDSLLRVFQAGANPRSFVDGSAEGQFDLPRALLGQIAGGFFAMQVPSPGERAHSQPDLQVVDGVFLMKPALPIGLSAAGTTTRAMRELLGRIETESHGRVIIARRLEDIIEAMNQGDRLAAVIHFEGAEAIDESLDSLRSYYDCGLRSLGIVWSRPNSFGHGVPIAFPGSPDTGPGLTDAGFALVRECNRLGIMIDLAHLNEKGFWDVAMTSNAPLVVTHSAAHALCQSSRNLTDRQLEAIARSNGLIGIAFFPGFLRADGRFDLPTSMSEIVRHVEYVAKKIGVAHVALGSDFDGAKMPDDLPDVASLPRLLDALAANGFSKDELVKIAHGNWLRIIADTWKSES
jgi:membrane dipeptidase